MEDKTELGGDIFNPIGDIIKPGATSIHSKRTFSFINIVTRSIGSDAIKFV